MWLSERNVHLNYQLKIKFFVAFCETCLIVMYVDIPTQRSAFCGVFLKPQIEIENPASD